MGCKTTGHFGLPFWSSHFGISNSPILNWPEPMGLMVPKWRLLDPELKRPMLGCLAQEEVQYLAAEAAAFSVPTRPHPPIQFHPSLSPLSQKTPTAGWCCWSTSWPPCLALRPSHWLPLALAFLWWHECAKLQASGTCVPLVLSDSGLGPQNLYAHQIKKRDFF